ncbi:hypothetical protein [Paenibacillus sp. FSL K6-1230]|uniref:hypothetical protein n=1 Tax=Paenibacillus sp. FSL K6-1230 TaxID=2921603 RepID=UPI0003A4DB3D
MIALADEVINPKELQTNLRVLALLDIILCDEEWLRYYTYEPAWAEGVSLAKVDDGSGNHMYVIFAPEGTIIKGFDHESELSPHAQEEYGVWPGMYDGMPAELMQHLQDDALEPEEVTFCYWRLVEAANWSAGPVIVPEGIDSGASWLLSTMYDTPEAYVDWANDYYELELEAEDVRDVFEGQVITEELITRLNPERDQEEALAELAAL